MRRKRPGGWAAIATWASLAGGCSCNGHAHEPGNAGTTAGGAGMTMAEDDSAAGVGGSMDGAIDQPDSAEAPLDTRFFEPTNGFDVPGHGVAWELNGGGTFVALWREDRSAGPHLIASGLTRMPWDDQLGDAWYCVGEGSAFTPRAGARARANGSLRNLTRLRECATGDDTVDIGETDLKFQVKSSLLELDIAHAQPLGARCVERDCDIYFSTLDERGGLGFLIMHMKTATAVTMTPHNPNEVPTEIESADIVLIRDDGTAVRACASGGAKTRDAASEATFSLTGVGEPVTCPGGSMGPSSLDFTALAR